MTIRRFTELAVVSVTTAQAIGQTNSDFSPPNAPRLINGLELRDRYKLPKHLDETSIYVDSVAVHHIHYEASTIVWKDAAGRWQRSQAVESGPGDLLTVSRKLDSSETETLKESDVQSLDSLIKDPSLYSGEVQRAGKVEIGAAFHVMAISTPYGRTTVKWDGRLLGKSGEVADIVLGHD